MIRCENVTKDFGQPPQRVLHGLSFLIESGEFVSISGRSGSGKSTLLYLLSTLDRPASGRVFIDDKDISTLSSEEVHAFRNERIGFIFQFHYLLPELTTLENVLLPARNLRRDRELTDFAQGLLKRLGISDCENRFPGQMSGGEQQRVAIARALILSPRYIFADEPTGNLDSTNARIVMDMLIGVNREMNTTVCLVTHEPSFARMAHREIYLRDGRLSSREADVSL